MRREAPRAGRRRGASRLSSARCVVAPRALELARERLVAAGAQPGRVLARGSRGAPPRRTSRSARATPGASSWSHSTGVSDSVSGAPRVEQVEQRQVAAGDRLPQPLLAERPGAEALDVGHVRVQDDRQRAAIAAAALTAGTPRRSPAPGRGRPRRRGAQREVRGGDRRREPVVEALGQAEARVHRVPAERAARARARAACARGTARTSRPLRSARGTAARTPAARYSCTCQGLSERAAPLRREREHVRGRDEHGSRARRRASGSARAPRPGPARCSIVCRNTTASAGSEKRLDQLALEAQVRARGSAAARARAPRGWRRRRRRSRRVAREHVRAVALAAGHVDHAQAARRARRSTRRRRGGGETSSSPPARPGACARPSAPAAERPPADRAARGGLTSEIADRRSVRPAGERRHGARVYGAAPCRPALSAEEIRDVNTRYHDVAADHYDSKWGIDFGELGHEQVLAKVRKALGRAPGHYARSLEIGAGTGYFTLNMLRAGPDRRGDLQRHLARACSRRSQANAERLGLEVRTGPADAERLPFADESFDLVLRPRGAAPHPRPAARVRASSSACSRPAARCCSPASPPATATAWRACPSALAGARRAAVAARDRRPRRAPRGDGGEPDAALEGVVDVHAFAPAELARAGARRRPRRRARQRRGAAGELVRLDQPHARGDRRARRRALGLAPVRLSRLPAAAGARPPAARVAAAGGDLLQPDARRAQAAD